MKRTWTLFAWFLGTMLLAQGAPGATVQVPVKGYLVALGYPVTAIVQVQLEVFDMSVGGTRLVHEQHFSDVTDGALSVTLGQFIPVPEEVFAGGTRYLQVTLNGSLLTPRIVITPGALPTGELTDEVGGLYTLTLGTTTPPGALPIAVGTNVAVDTTVQVPNGGPVPVSLLFDNVTVAGTTTITPSSNGPAPPPSFKLGTPPAYVDLTTTAQFTGGVTLCFGWSEGQFSNENRIRLYHYEGGEWVNVTVSRDTVNNLVCGRTMTLSPFALMEPAYAFAGFFAPVNNMPTLNTVKAGSAIPVKFSLGADQTLDIFSHGYPASAPVSCEANDSADAVEQTVTAGASSLSYNPSANIYTYIWKTEKGWAGTCRQLLLQFNDGSVGRAKFKFH